MDLVAGDLVNILAVSLGLDNIDSYADQIGSSTCMDWGNSTTDQLFIYQTSLPTLCAAEALKNIVDQGGIYILDSYSYTTTGDDHINLSFGTDGVSNSEFF